MQIIRYRSDSAEGGVALGVASGEQLIGHFTRSDLRLGSLLGMRAQDLRALLETVERSAAPPEMPAHVLAPIDGAIEVWSALQAEAPGEHPALLFKASARRVAAPNTPLVVRADSAWNVPESALTLVVNAYAEIVGYTIGLGISARSLEDESPLYLSQARTHAACCALGPAIVPAWEVADPYNLAVHVQIERMDAAKEHERAVHLLWEGKVSTHGLRRLEDLVAYLFREDEFPEGVLLCCETGPLPERSIALKAGDVVQVAIEGLGVLRNPVVRGKAALHAG